METSSTIQNQQTKIKCESTLSGSRSWLLLLSEVSLSLAPMLSKLKHHHQAIVCALRATLVTLTAKTKVLILTATINTRIYTGLVLIFSTPLVWYLFRFFDRRAKVQMLGFHENWFYVLMNLGPLLSWIIFLVGLYHTLPYKCWQSKVVAAFNGLLIAKIIWNLLATSNDEYNSVPDSLFLLLGVFVSLLLHASIDFFAWRKFHRFDGLTCRMKGIINLPGVDQETKNTMLFVCINELETFHKTFKK
jgi:hypothetical protein